MAEPDTGTGGGTTSLVCTVSPSDQEAIVNNLIKRIADMETFLSRLVAYDVYASNLAELADNLGSILNGEIMLPSSGNSPYGVGGSIPVPSDYTGTYISGNVITIWNNGVVTYELINGIPSTGGGTGSITQYHPTSVSSGLPVFTLAQQTDANISLCGNSCWSFSQTGWYSFIFNIEGVTDTGTDAVSLGVDHRDSDGNLLNRYLWNGWGYGAAHTYTINLNAVFRIGNTSERVTLLSFGDFTSWGTGTDYWLNVIKIRTL